MLRYEVFNDEETDKNTLFGYDLSFSPKGSVSFNSDINPSDF
jgi:hypothetical protein